MNRDENHRENGRFRNYVILATKGMVALLVVSTFIAIGWNLAIPEILGIEKISGKTGFGLALLGFTLASLVRAGLSVTHRRCSKSA